MQQQEADYKWFLEHYEQLFKEYGTSYLAIKEGKPRMQKRFMKQKKMNR